MFCSNLHCLTFGGAMYHCDHAINLFTTLTQPFAHQFQISCPRLPWSRREPGFKAFYNLFCHWRLNKPLLSDTDKAYHSLKRQIFLLPAESSRTAYRSSSYGVAPYHYLSTSSTCLCWPHHNRPHYQTYNTIFEVASETCRTHVIACSPKLPQWKLFMASLPYLFRDGRKQNKMILPKFCTWR